MVITARRGQPGAERAQLIESKPTGQPGTMADAPVPASKTTKTPPPIAAAKARSLAAARVSDLLRQIRLSEVQGRPADELRQQLSQAVEAMQQ